MLAQGQFVFSSWPSGLTRWSSFLGVIRNPVRTDAEVWSEIARMPCKLAGGRVEVKRTSAQEPVSGKHRDLVRFYRVEVIVESDSFFWYHCPLSSHVVFYAFFCQYKCTLLISREVLEVHGNKILYVGGCAEVPARLRATPVARLLNTFFGCNICPVFGLYRWRSLQVHKYSSCSICRDLVWSTSLSL